MSPRTLIRVGVVLVLCLFGADLYLAWKAQQAHDALCAIRADYQIRIDSSRRFLTLSMPEKVKEFGPALAKTPDSVVHVNIANYQRNLAVFDASLDC